VLLCVVGVVVCKRGGEVSLQLSCVRRYSEGGGLLAGIRDPVPFDPWIRDPGSRMGRKSASRSGIRDEQLGSYFLELRNHFLIFLRLKYLTSLMRIRDPERRQVGSGMEKSWIRDRGSGIQDKDPGSATLLYVVLIAL
jgi:hypothetical protein